MSSSVQYVQSVRLTSDFVNFPVEVLNGRWICLVKLIMQKSRHDGRLPNFAEKESWKTVLTRQDCEGARLCVRRIKGDNSSYVKPVSNYERNARVGLYRMARLSTVASSYSSLSYPSMTRGQSIHKNNRKFHVQAFLIGDQMVQIFHGNCCLSRIPVYPLTRQVLVVTGKTGSPGQTQAKPICSPGRLYTVGRPV